MSEAGRGRVLLALARGSLAEAFGQGQANPPAEPWLAEPGATFVTLTRNGELRGCVGSVSAHRALGEDVAANARAAAFSDPRFPPLASAELPAISIEVSELSPSRLLPAGSEEEALAHLRPGRDGVILSYRGTRATFLPQVWEKLPEPRAFLAQLKRKAGLPAAFWSPEIHLETYEVTKWEERPSRC